jgi:hypothetical protein
MICGCVQEHQQPAIPRETREKAVDIEAPGVDVEVYKSPDATEEESNEPDASVNVEAPGVDTEVRD